ncbi:MAG: sigma-70 family RNA polymerase sigma factor [Candidatus Dadabacteria bacterium]|nr:MAG: sigma-70 family RNA polymerase sigma factor [Candidatus Dadabacteria bacterium]
MHDQSQNDANQDLIENYSYLVKKIAASLVKRMKLPKDEFEEYEAAGYLGLVEAASRYSPQAGDFASFAFMRIRGAIIDDIRKRSDLKRDNYHRMKALSAANDLRQEVNAPERNNTSAGLASVLEYAAKSAMIFRISFEHNQEKVSESAATDENPEKLTARKESLKIILEIIATLPEKQRLIVEEHYFRDKPFIQIVNENEGMSKSWVSRLHAKAISTIKDRYLEMLEKQQG